MAEEEVPQEETPEEPENQEWDSRKMDPDEKLWDDGPNFKQINEWKDQYGDIYVTSLTPEKHFVWRTVNRAEYRQLVKFMESAVNNGKSQTDANMDNEEQIAEMCILFPPYKRTENGGHLAGTAATLSTQILEASGFVALEIRQL